MKKNKHLIMLIIAVAIITITSFATPPAGLSQSGFMVLGILVSAILLWANVNLEWPCLFVIFALCLVPELGLKTVAANSFGSSTPVFFITMFILASSLITTGVAKRIAVLIMSSNLSKKSPWWNVFTIFLGGFVLAQGLAAPGIMVICFPILYEIFAMAGYEKGEETPKMLMLGTAIVVQMAMGMTPICHAVVTTGLGTYNSYTGQTITLADFCLIGIPTGLILFFVIFLICRYIWKPDTSKLANVDHDGLRKNLGPVTIQEKIALGTYFVVLLLWILPGLKNYIPALSFLGNVQNVYPPIVAISLLSVIRVDGKPILDYSRAIKTDVPWKVIIFASSIQAISSALSNKDIGVSAWLGEVLTPVFGGFSPVLFLIMLIILVLFMTQFVSNSVTLAVAFAIGLPLAASAFGDAINTMVMSIILMSAANMAFAAPSGTHALAMVETTGWVDTKTMFKYGMITALASLVVFCLISIPLGNVIF